MFHIYFRLFLFVVLPFTSGESVISNSVDKFKLNESEVEVFFIDPFVNIIAGDAVYFNKTNKEKSNILYNYLHNNILYVFKVTTSSGNIVLFRITGNPTLEKTERFYHVQVLERFPLNDSGVMSSRYFTAITAIFDNVNCSGALFENMEIFKNEDKMKFTLNGIKLFGNYRKVESYSVIKNSMISIIINYFEQ